MPLELLEADELAEPEALLEALLLEAAPPPPALALLLDVPPPAPPVPPAPLVLEAVDVPLVLALDVATSQPVQAPKPAPAASHDWTPIPAPPGQGQASTRPGTQSGAPELDDAVLEVLPLAFARPAPSPSPPQALPNVNAPSPTTTANLWSIGPRLRSVGPRSILRSLAGPPALPGLGEEVLRADGAPLDTPDAGLPPEDDNSRPSPTLPLPPPTQVTGAAAQIVN